MRYTCTTCLIEKDATEFYAEKRNTVKGIRSNCKECVKAHQKAHPTPYSVKNREYKRQWRAANIDHCREVERAKRKRNIDKCRAYTRAWLKRNPEARKQRRIAYKTLVPQWAEHELIAVVYRKAKEYGMTVDHVVPLKHPLVCGLHAWSNLQLMDQGMNSTKNNRFWPDMPEQPLSAARMVALTGA